MHPVITIALLTVHEAARRRILLAALLLGGAFLAIYATGFYFAHDNVTAEQLVDAQRRIVFNMLAMAGLYAVNFLTVMASILIPIDTISGEIESGVMQTIATKPVARWNIVVGKWLGFVVVLAGYLAVMAGGVLAITRIISGFVPPNAAFGVSLMLLEGALFVTISIAAGTRLSTLANGVLGFGLFGLAFIGGWMEQIGTVLGNGTTRNVGIVASLVVPSESLWQLAAYNMQPSIMRDVNFTPFSPASVPSGAMVAWAACYLVVALLIAVRLLRTRDL